MQRRHARRIEFSNPMLPQLDEVRPRRRATRKLLASSGIDGTKVAQLGTHSGPTQPMAHRCRHGRETRITLEL